MSEGTDILPFRHTEQHKQPKNNPLKTQRAVLLAQVMFTQVIEFQLLFKTLSFTRDLSCSEKL